MTNHISCGAVVYKNDNNQVMILLLERKLTNSWHLPKGTQNLGETIEQTVLREVEEETGLMVNLGEYLGKLDSVFERNGPISKTTHYFLATPISGDISKHDKEHDEVVFVEYKTALSRLENFSLHEEEGKILKMAESRFA
jgi:ADP-ribose pyrophosphatase YjhB (NUDIX family)